MSRIVRFFTAIVGPAAVMAAGTMGAGATASLILSGAWFRYDLLWVIVLIVPLFVISVDSASRIGLIIRDQGMFSIIRSRIHPGVAWLLFAINIPIHLLIGMGQISVMTSALMSLFGFYPPEPGMAESYATNYKIAEVLLSVGAAAALVWLLTSGGYQRMQKVMTGLMVIMFVSFLLVALNAFSEIGEIIKGFTPRIPDNLPIPGGGERVSTSSIIAIVGSALAPAALLGIPYMSSDNLKGSVDFNAERRKAWINLGLIFGGYSMFVVVAGGFALYPLENNAAIDEVHEAGRVLVNAFPAGLSFLGPFIFSAGLFMAAVTTFVVVVQVVCYFWLDMTGKDWHDTVDNKGFKRLVRIWVILPAILAPFWDFPALLKVILLMGFNVLVIPIVMLAVIFLVNSRDVMGDKTAGISRNIVLMAGLGLSLWLTVDKLPGYLGMLFG